MNIIVNKSYKYQKQNSVLRYILCSWRSLEARDMDEKTYTESIWCGQYFNDFSELFTASHCVYLVLTKKKQTRTPFAVRAYNTQCGDEPVLFYDCRKKMVIVLFSHHCMWLHLSNCFHYFFERTAKLCSGSTWPKWLLCCWEVKVL